MMTANWNPANEPPQSNDYDYVLISDGEAVRIGYYLSHRLFEEQYWCDCFGQRADWVTHWAPLPAAPMITLAAYLRACDLAAANQKEERV